MPLEDYTTEVLVGILEDRKELLDLFVNQILKIEGNNFKIESQKKYYLEDDIDCIVDIVIENDQNICFLENKVNACEGERQLERYTQVLHNLKSKAIKNVYLRYCTKYYDKKEISEIDFAQFRWKDVYKFLNEAKDYFEMNFGKSRHQVEFTWCFLCIYFYVYILNFNELSKNIE